MSAFKDAVSNDIMSVFLNVDEFADKHVLNGKKVICIVDKDLTEAAKKTVSNPLDGVFINAVMIFVKSSDLERQPVEGELLYLDDKMYIVRNVSEEMDVLSITAEANNQ